MKCPMCETILVMTVREAVEIDYCPKCRGVWLDRGELDKLISLTVPSSGVPRPVRERRDLDDSNDDVFEDSRDHRLRGMDRFSTPRKRESFWGQLFDFD